MADLSPSRTSARPRWAPWLPSWPLAFGLLVFVELLAFGSSSNLLTDPDTQWHIAVGRWIVSHRAVPTVDAFSHSFAGRPWIAKEWLSQILLATAYDMAGWAGVKILVASTIAATFALLLRLLLRSLAPLPATILAFAAVALSAPHLLARPHVFAFPLMLLWVAGLIRAVEERRAPSWALIPVMVAWANLHGGFTLGLLLAAAFALDALVAARGVEERRGAFIAWAKFGVMASLAACVTPYGPESILVTGRIFGLGAALHLINEWRSPDFNVQYLQGILLLIALLAALVSGLKVPLVRAAIVGGLLCLYFKHARNGEIFATLAPLVLAPVVARQWPVLAPDQGRWIAYGHRASKRAIAIAAALAVLVAATILHDNSARPPAAISPLAALEFVRKVGIGGRVLNDYNFGGFLILNGVQTFIDGRGELYGGQFILQYGDAVSLRSKQPLDKFLDDHGIDWTMLQRGQPANRLLARLPGWRLAYLDDDVEIFVRANFSPKG